MCKTHTGKALSHARASPEPEMNLPVLEHVFPHCPSMCFPEAAGIQLSSISLSGMQACMQACMHSRTHAWMHECMTIVESQRLSYSIATSHIYCLDNLFPAFCLQFVSGCGPGKLGGLLMTCHIHLHHMNHVIRHCRYCFASY